MSRSINFSFNNLSCSENGLGLTELIIGLVVFSILALIAIPTIPEVLGSLRRDQARQQLEFDLRRARTEAITEGARGIVTVAGDGASYTVGFDNVPYNNPVASDTVLLTRQLPDGITITASDSIIFDARGRAVDINGAMTTVTFGLSLHADLFQAATLYPVGIFEFD